MATYSSNTTLKVNRAISGATTVGANSYAVVNYIYSSYAVSTQGPRDFEKSIVKYFGPLQSIPASLNIYLSSQSPSGGGPEGTVTYSLSSGVEFINTPL